MNRLRHHMPEVRAIAARSDLDSRSDADLLDRFARYGEHAAFEVLLRRHAGVVHGVCRRMLPNPADADDAFQATFLVLVRRASGVRAEKLGPWLYGVAVRVAMKARSFAARAAARHTEATDMIPDPSETSAAADWLPILDAELAAIPAKYREPMVLCELQGLSRSAAAKALGIREGTLSSRLSRGREMLRKRLLRHGTLLPTGGLAALLPAEGRGAASAGLLARTAELVGGAGVAGAVPAGPARLTDEVVKGMFLTKLKTAGGAALVLGLLAVGLLAASPAELPGQVKDTKSVAKLAPVAAKPDVATTKAMVGPDEKLVQGYWLMSGYNDARKEKQDAKTPETRVLVEGNTWWLLNGNDAVRLTVKLDSARNPKFIDSLPLEGNSQHVGLFGLYRLPDVDTLELCLSQGVRGKSIRPAEFGADVELSISTARFRRIPLPAIPADKAPAREKLHGLWTSATPPQPGDVSSGGTEQVEFTPHFAFVSYRPNDWAAYTYDTDTDKSPSWIDLTPVRANNPDAVTPIYGVYQLGKDGGLKLALGSTPKRLARPLEFVTDPQKQVHTLVMARVEKKGSAGEGKK